MNRTGMGIVRHEPHRGVQSPHSKMNVEINPPPIKKALGYLNASGGIRTLDHGQRMGMAPRR
jgi:hypothetical protein